MPVKKTHANCTQDIDAFFSPVYDKGKKTYRNCNHCIKVQKKSVPFINEATTLHYHLQAYHKADYLQWAVANKFASMLPWDMKCCHKDALLHMQSNLDSHLAPRE
ncbi:hypothetical protein EDC04DRAFT_2605211 [Pisolithus marmoratus]|nr:hypothetical protein EDC04DRAFT_2605211 [Pisolithus marmoratus]